MRDAVNAIFYISWVAAMPFVLPSRSHGEISFDRLFRRRFPGNG